MVIVISADGHTKEKWVNDGIIETLDEQPKPR
jgi:hypothetical protein